MKELRHQTASPEKKQIFFSGSNFSGLNFYVMRKAFLLVFLLIIFTLKLTAAQAISFSFDEKGKYKNWTENGKFGEALLFKGDGGMKIDDISSFQFSPGQSFTLELWIKPTTQDTRAKQTILAQEDLGIYWKFYLYAGGRLGFVSGTKEKQNINFLSGENSIGKWSHLAFVRDCEEGMVRYYFNGKLLREEKDPGTSGQFFIKQSVFVASDKNGKNAFEGLVDEITVSRYAKREFKQEETSSLKTLEKSIVYKPLPPESEPPNPQIAASWNEIDKAALSIVPCPKEFKLTGGGPLKINSDEWTILFENPNVKAGVDEINLKLVELGNKEIALNEKNKTNKIIAGTFESLKEYLSKIGNPEKPRRQGYVIGFYEEHGNQNCIIAGTDESGVQYGCVTLSMMLKKGNEGVELTKARVMDWPDYKYRMGFEVYGSNVEQGKKIIDKAFLFKYNMIAADGFYRTIESMLETAAQRKILYKYAADRGIRVVMGGRFDVGVAPYPKDMNGYTVYYYPYKTEEGLLGNLQEAYTWSRDDLIDKKGDLAATFMRESGANAFFFHAMDCGERDNPENWNYRTPMDKKRWDNDRAGADANLINRILKKMKEENPDAMMLAIIYPYGAGYLKYPEVKAWLNRLSTLVPENIFFCVRESVRENMEKWKDSTRQGRFIYHEPFPWSLRIMFATAGRYAKTFFFDDKDIYWFCSSGNYQWPAVGVAAEYCWNTDAPGWRWQPENHREMPQLDSIPPEISGKLLPRICAILWGEKATAKMSLVYLQNLSCEVTSNMSQFTGADPLAYFKSKYEASKKALDWINEAEKEVRPSSIWYYKMVKNFVFNARYLTEAKYRYYFSRELLSEEKYEEAEREIELAKKALANLAQNDKHANVVMKELDIASTVRWHRERNEYLKREKYKAFRIGVYSMNLGLYRGVVDSFKGIPGIKIEPFNDPTKKELKKYDVIIFPACNDMWDTTEDWRENVKEFVNAGGGVIFSHNAVGRISSSAFGNTLFPEICSGYAGQLANRRVLEATEAHPATGLEKDRKFEHEYNDHIFIKPGPEGKVLLKDELGKPVMTVGVCGKGRVIYTGQIFGINKKEEQKESPGEEWKVLFNMALWASKGTGIESN